MPLTLNRWLTILVVSCTVALQNDFIPFAVALGISHYLVAFWYSRHRLLKLFLSRRSRLSVTGLTALSSLACLLNFPGGAVTLMVHHGLNEVYVFPHFYRKEKQTRALVGARLAFNFLAYAFILRRHHSYAGVPSRLVFASLIIAAAGVGIILWKQRLQLSRTSFLDHLAFETSTLLFIAASLFYPISFLMVAFYHFAFWLFYPLLNERGEGGFVSSIATVLLTAILLSPLGNRFFDALSLRPIQLAQGVGYFHVGLSFVLSSLNPPPVLRLFRGALAAQS